MASISRRSPSASALAGYFVGRAHGPWRADLALLAGGGLVSQHLDHAETFNSPTLVVAPQLSAGVALTARWALFATGQLSGSWVRRDHDRTVAWLPAGYLGLAVDL